MSYFGVWLVLSAGGCISAWAGVNSWDTAFAGAYFGGLALLVHWLYETR